MKQCLTAKITTILQHAPLVQNLARQKFVAHFIIALIKSRNVLFGEVAQHLNEAVKPASNETRIQDFFREVELDYLALARLLVSLLPPTGKLRLCLDRTEWDVGQCQVNVLLVTVGRGAWHVPFYWEMLDNRSGNSNAAQRIAVLQVCLDLLGRERIGLVLGDREFVGHAWLKWLKDNGLNFVMRVPRHHYLTGADGQPFAVAELGLAVGQVRRWPRVQVDGVWGQAWVQALAGDDLLFLFGNVGLPYMDQLYARRWTIEQCFQNLKGRGFHLENTRLRCRRKLRMLVALVSLAYAFCLSVGQAAARRAAPVARKKHGYPATSLSRHGLNILRQLTQPLAHTTAMSCYVNALLDWMIIQVRCYQRVTKIVG